MYNGKRAKSGSAKHLKRSLALVASLMLLLSIGIGATLAWLTDKTENVQNVFTPAAVPPVIEETKPEENNNVKENVSVTNTGNVSAYIRAAVVVNWLDDKGNIVADSEGHTCSIVYTDSEDWVKGADGYYYYVKPVAAGTGTTELITSAAPAAGSQYRLQIDILAQTIQSEGVDSATGKSPVVLAWGVDKGGCVTAVGIDGSLTVNQG